MNQLLLNPPIEDEHPDETHPVEINPKHSEQDNLDQKNSVESHQGKKESALVQEPLQQNTPHVKSISTTLPRMMIFGTK